MRRTTSAWSGAVPFLTLLILMICGPQATGQTDSISVGEYTVSGPYTYRNLNVYLVHGRDQIRGRKVMTLAEAMRRKKIRVYETGSVNELSVENISATESILIQAGEIVKGGQQDRTLGKDLVLAPRSGRVSIAAFCVEQGRWSGRGGESTREFNSSEEQLVSRELKLAARYHKDQGKVWTHVRRAQDKLSENVGESVNDRKSASSLQLSLENERLRRTVNEYAGALEGIVGRRRDVIGCVIAVNGEMSGAEIYASADLFRRSWPKLLRAASIEAVAEEDSAWEPMVVPVARAKEFIAPESTGTTTTESVATGVDVVTVDRDESVAIETRSGDVAVRKSWIRK